MIFYAAGNAANGFGLLGDHIYTGSTSVVSAPEPASSVGALAVLVCLGWIRRRAA